MKKVRIARRMLAVFSTAAWLVSGCHRTPEALPVHPRLSSGVAIQDVSFYSHALKRQMPYRVFLPSTIVPGNKLPVIYLLHGSGGGFRDWSNYSDVSQYASKDRSGGLILVMPEGNSSYWVNAAMNPADNYEDYLVNDLRTDVEARFPASTDRQSRAIIGVSMGGFAAIKLALTRPDLFSFAGAISPAIDVPSRRFTWRRAEQSWRFRVIFGPADSRTRQACDPFVLVQSADPAVTPYIYQTAGEQEPLLEPNRRFVARLRARHFLFEFHTKPGGHDWGEWDQQVPGCFESLMSHLNRPA
jgi:putative tributyrin esterase